jgi:hypothetical protein
MLWRGAGALVAIDGTSGVSAWVEKGTTFDRMNRISRM